MELQLIWKFSFLLIIPIFSVTVTAHGSNITAENSEYLKAERHLYQKLFDPQTYIRDIRPALRANDTVTVTMSINIFRIGNLDAQNHKMELSFHLMQLWVDPRLTWDPSQYAGIKTMVVPSAKVWKPDLTVYNSASIPGMAISSNGGQVHITSDAMVIWVPEVRTQSSCPMDLTYFPHDTQVCRLTMGSWVFPSHKVHFVLTEKGIALNEEVVGNDSSKSETYKDSLSEHPAWDLDNNVMDAKIEAVKFPCCPETYDTVTFKLTFHRRAGHYDNMIVGPVILLALLVPVIFILPANSPQKTVLGAAIIISLSFTAYLFLFIIPPSYASTIPRVGTFIIGTYVLTAISIVVAAIVNSTASKNARPRPVPSWMRTVFLSRNGLRRFLCMETYLPIDNRNFIDAMQKGDHYDDPIETNRELGALPSMGTEDIARYMRFLVEKYSANDAIDKVNEEWLEVARSLDRLFLIIFLILVLVITFFMVA